MQSLAESRLRAKLRPVAEPGKAVRPAPFFGSIKSDYTTLFFPLLRRLGRHRRVGAPRRKERLQIFRRYTVARPATIPRQLAGINLEFLRRQEAME
jgi:hypothetical protein